MKIMEDIIKTNVSHMEHLKSTITQLKKQLMFEQKRNQELEKDNELLKEQIKNHHYPPLKQIQQVHSPTNSKPPLKLDIQSALRKQSQTSLTCVKKSTTYMEAIKDEKHFESIKESVVSTKLIRKGSQVIKNQNSFNFEFQGPSSAVFDNKSSDKAISEFHGNNTIQEEPLKQADTSVCILPEAKLFEHFYIMGCNKREFLEFDNDQNIKEGILPASIMYKSSQAEPFDNIIQEFAYPFGNQVEKIKVNDSFRKIKEMMYSGNKYELMDKFYMFTINNQSDTEYSNQNLLSACNPERLLYGICLSVYDFIETTPDSIELTFKNRKKRIFWKYKKTYCFLTYFPFYELFQDLLIAVINLIKMNRTDKYLKKSTQEYDILKEVDGQSIIQGLEQELRQFLEQISLTPSNFYQQLEIPTLAGNLKYRIPNQLSIVNELRIWCTNITLQILNYREIVTIYSAMISEQSLIFICEKLSILTAIIHFFHQVIKPLQWTYPIIYCLPESLLPMIESPVPIIVGLNLHESDLPSFDIIEGKDSIFVYLDREKDKVAQSAGKLPYSNGLLLQLEANLRTSSSIRNPSPGSASKIILRKSVKFVPDDQDYVKSKVVLDIFTKILNDVISKLPPKNEGADDGVVKLEFIERILLQLSDPRDRDFVKCLVQSQSFNYFLEELYLK